MPGSRSVHQKRLAGSLVSQQARISKVPPVSMAMALYSGRNLLIRSGYAYHDG